MHVRNAAQICEPDTRTYLRPSYAGRSYRYLVQLQAISSVNPEVFGMHLERFMLMTPNLCSYPPSWFRYLKTTHPKHELYICTIISIRLTKSSGRGAALGEDAVIYSEVGNLPNSATLYVSIEFQQAQ